MNDRTDDKLLQGGFVLTRAHRMADIIIQFMDEADLRQGIGSREDPKRPSWGLMTKWISKALEETKGRRNP